MANSYLASRNLVNDFLKDYFRDQYQVKVLEAGCGSATHFELNEKYQLTGIDISMKQLERNAYISEKICGDIQTYKFNNQSFDMIVSWFVLEHLKHPLVAMSNFLQAIKSNGLIILAVPNIWSLKGIITKITPTFLHIWYYKHILKMESAGKNDSGPFKTYLRFSISPNNIKRYAKLNNINVVFFEYMYNKNLYTKVKSNLLTYLLQEFIGFLLFLLSFGKIKKTNQDYLIILKK